MYKKRNLLSEDGEVVRVAQDKTVSVYRCDGIHGMLAGANYESLTFE
jgi:hypothetical protein